MFMPVLSCKMELTVTINIVRHNRRTVHTTPTPKCAHKHAPNQRNPTRRFPNRHARPTKPQPSSHPHPRTFVRKAPHSGTLPSRLDPDPHLT
jgi:hypothetical protein